MNADDPSAPPPGDPTNQIQDLAARILDGAPINWQSDAAGLDPESVEELRALEALVRVHRDLPDPGISSRPAVQHTDDEHLESWGPLKLIERIAEGAFGEVYRAWDTRLDREVALKLLHTAPDDLDHGAAIAEGRLLARVRHPNVVTVFGAERIDGRVGIWTEFVHGTTLAAVARDQGRLDLEHAIAIGLDLCRALGAIHAAGIVHGDIKAQNVLQEQGGRIVLVDFGTGRERVHEVSSLHSRSISGTPLYMAPELWEHAEPSPITDLYALGVLLYYLLSGTYPVRGETATEIHEAHATGRRVALREERPSLPTGIAALIDRATAASPGNRFATAHEFAAALERVRPSRIRRRRRRLAAAAGGAAGLASLLALAWTGGLRSLRAGVDSPVELTAEQLTFQPIERPVLAAAISPDERYLAYADLTGLHLQSTGAPDTRRLLLPDGIGAINDVAWLPNSSEIVLATSTAVWRASVADGSAVRLADVGGLVAVSPDGRHLAVRDSAVSQILVMTTEGRDLRLAVPAEPGVGVSRPAWSPDSRWIAYGRSWTDDILQRAIVVCRIDTLQRSTMVELPGFFSLVWAPDWRLLFARNRPGRYGDLWEIEVDPATVQLRGGPTKFAHALDLNFNKPSLTGSGAFLTFTVNRHVSQVVLADFDSGALTLGSPRRVVFSDQFAHPLSWTPAGDALLFLAGDGSPRLRIYHQSLQSAGPATLVRAPPEAGEFAAVSPDGQSIVMSRLRKPWGLMRVPVAGGAAERLFDLRSIYVSIRCTRLPASLCAAVDRLDGDSHKGDLVSFDPRGGGLRRHGMVEGAWDVSADGREVVFLDPTHRPGRLQIVDLATDRRSVIDDASLRGAQWIAWTLDGSGWVLARYPGERGSEVLYLSRTGESKRLWESAHVRLRSPLLSPDGRRLAFAAGWRESNAWGLRGF